MNLLCLFITFRNVSIRLIPDQLLNLPTLLRGIGKEMYLTVSSVPSVSYTPSPPLSDLSVLKSLKDVCPRGAFFS